MRPAAKEIRIHRSRLLNWPSPAAGLVESPSSFCNGLGFWPIQTHSLCLNFSLWKTHHTPSPPQRLINVRHDSWICLRTTCQFYLCLLPAHDARVTHNRRLQLQTCRRKRWVVLGFLIWETLIFSFLVLGFLDMIFNLTLFGWRLWTISTILITLMCYAVITLQFHLFREVLRGLYKLVKWGSNG
jgi:hypothetical protein